MSYPNPSSLNPKPAPILQSFRAPLPGNQPGNELWLDRRREGYGEDCAWWKFLRECDEGGREWLNGKNLPPHFLEIERNAAGDAKTAPSSGGAGGAGAHGMSARSDYEIRLANAFRFNLVREAVDAYMGFISTAPPAREFPAKLAPLKEFEQAADRGRSRDLTALVQQACRDALLLGIAHVAIDVATTAEDVKQRLADAGIEGADASKPMVAAIARGIRGKGADGRPYAYRIQPEDVLDFILNADGSYAQVLIREWVNVSDDLEAGPSGLKPVYRKWTATDWTLYEIRENDGGKRVAVQLETGSHDAGRVPVISLVLHERRASGRGRSQVEDLSLVDRGLTDLVTSLAFGLGNASDLQVNVFTDLTSIQGQEESKKLEFERGAYAAASSTVGLFNKDDRVEILEKTFAAAALMLQSFSDLYRLALRSQSLGEKIDDTEQSGVSRLRAAQPLNAALSAIGACLQRFERAVLLVAATYLGVDPTGEEAKALTVSYPRNFDVLSIDALLLLLKELDGKVPDEVYNWIVEQVMAKSFPNRSAKVLEEHEKAIRAFKRPSMDMAFGRFGDEAAAPGQDAAPADSTEPDAGPDSGAPVPGKGAPPPFARKRGGPPSPRPGAGAVASGSGA